MNRDDFLKYTEEAYSVVPDNPFADDQSISVFRHENNRKWFAVVMSIPRSRLGLDGDTMIDIVNLKCDPEVKYAFINGDGIFPAYHMSKRHWISVALDHNTDDDKLKWLLDISYDLTGIRKNKCRD